MDFSKQKSKFAWRLGEYVTLRLAAQSATTLKDQFGYGDAAEKILENIESDIMGLLKTDSCIVGGTQEGALGTQEVVLCGLCGQPMPPGEEVFKYHGYSGPCPQDALKSEPTGVP